MSATTQSESSTEYVRYTAAASDQQAKCMAFQRNWNERCRIDDRIVSDQPPVADPVDRRFLRLMNTTRLVATIGGTAVFVGLTLLAVDSSLRFVAALVSAVCGYLIGRVFVAAVVLGSGADSHNPNSMQRIRQLALVAAAMVVGALAVFMFMRFNSNDATVALFSSATVLFEFGVFLIAGTAEAAHLVRAWTVEIPLQYDIAIEARNRANRAAISCAAAVGRNSSSIEK